MAAATYYQVPTEPEHTHMRGSHVGETQYEGGWKPLDYEHVNKLQREDEQLKRRIRMLRVISRILAFLISIIVFVPITLTLAKFLATRDIYHEVQLADGSTILRTAWASNSVTWPTYMYFGIAFVSLTLNGVIMLAYLRDVRSANRAATVATTFTSIILIGNVVVWAVGAGLYRYGKDNSKEKDLWGWTCSKAAEEIQKVFDKEVQFNQYCNVQSFSWYAGLAQLGAAALSIFIYFLVIKRRRSKKSLNRASQRLMEGY